MKSTLNLGQVFTCLMLMTGGVLTMAALPCNLKITEYPGSSERQGRQGTSDIFAFDHEVIQPIDPTTGEATGVHQHRAFTVLKFIDKASPGLHKALAVGQRLNTAILDFYRIDPASREEVKYYTITLKNVRVIGIKTLMPTAFLPENEAFRHMEEVRMAYEQIEWNWIPDQIVEMDNWRPSPTLRSASSSVIATNSPPPIGKN